MKLKNVYLNYNRHKGHYTGTIGFGDGDDEVTFTLTESEAEDLAFSFRDRLKAFAGKIEQSIKD